MITLFFPDRLLTLNPKTGDLSLRKNCCWLHKDAMVCKDQFRVCSIELPSRRSDERPNNLSGVIPRIICCISKGWPLELKLISLDKKSRNRPDRFHARENLHRLLVSNRSIMTFISWVRWMSSGPHTSLVGVLNLLLGRWQGRENCEKLKFLIRRKIFWLEMIIFELQSTKHGW